MIDERDDMGAMLKIQPKAGNLGLSDENAGLTFKERKNQFLFLVDALRTFDLNRTGNFFFKTVALWIQMTPNNGTVRVLREVYN